VAQLSIMDALGTPPSARRGARGSSKSGELDQGKPAMMPSPPPPPPPEPPPVVIDVNQPFGGVHSRGYGYNQPARNVDLGPPSPKAYLVSAWSEVLRDAQYEKRQESFFVRVASADLGVRLDEEGRLKIGEWLWKADQMKDAGTPPRVAATGGHSGIDVTSPTEDLTAVVQLALGLAEVALAYCGLRKEAVSRSASTMSQGRQGVLETSWDEVASATGTSNGMVVRIELWVGSKRVDRLYFDGVSLWRLAVRQVKGFWRKLQQSLFGKSR
jgi:hypothetical protein